MSISNLRGALEWALMVGFVFGAGAIAQAQDDKSQKDGPVVQIGRVDGTPTVPDDSTVKTSSAAQSQAPKFWIGLLGGTISADNPLRAHLDLPEHQGLLVVNVVPDSPAAKAGLKQHDILLRANDTDLHEMTDLVNLVSAEGEKKGEIKLEVFRHGKHENLTLTPEERPADAGVGQPMPGNFGSSSGIAGMADDLGPARELLQRFQAQNNNPLVFRNFGNGVVFQGNGQGVTNIPNGVSISIQKQNDQPTKITVKRDNDTWEVTGDDEESLKKLPEDLRPMVEQMLHGSDGNGFKIRLPNVDHPRVIDGGNGPLNKRLEQMEKQMQQLMERFEKDQPNDSHEREELHQEEGATK